MRVTISEFQSLDLQAHTFLKEVPLHDVSAIDLPSDGERIIADVRALLSSDGVIKPNPIVSALFKLRFFLGRILGWDKDPEQFEKDSYLNRLSVEQRSKSLLMPGTPDGPFRVLYVFPQESVSEIQNATVHAFLCIALVEIASGYRLYWAVYVRPVSWFTPIYMAIIDPFRRFVVYPAMLRRIRSAWIQKYCNTNV